MLNVLSKTIALGAGNTVYAGRTRPGAPPIDTSTLRPPAGYFKDISLNTLQEAFAAVGVAINDVNGPFCNWVSGQATDEGFTMYGGGHLSAGSNLSAGTSNFSLATRMWSIRNRPPVTLIEDAAAFDLYGESTNSATLGYTYPPHTYGGLIWQSPSEGGGTKGTLWHNFYPGSPWYNTVHKFDLSSDTAKGVRVIDHIPMGTGNGKYPMAAKDSARGGYWLSTTDGAGPLTFVRWDGTYTQYAGIAYGIYGDNSMIYLPAPYDCLVGMGRANSDNTLFQVYVCPIVGGVPQGFVNVVPTGTPPADGRSGGDWVQSLNCIVSYEGDGSARVHRLTPPAASALTTGTWAWTFETMQGQGGATPSRTGLNTNNGAYYPMNGSWSRFRYHAGLDAFLWDGGATAPFQIWTLQGM